MSRLIQLTDLSLYFPEKICFEEFTYSIHAGDRIALIGDNGSGKSSMLKVINKLLAPSDGHIHYIGNVTIGYVPQLSNCNHATSGAEQFNQALSLALAQDPDVLLLDEPTNHLDNKNRQSLLRLLDQFSGTLIIASHDVHLLRTQEYCFWHFIQNRINTFQGYFDHLQQQNLLELNILHEEIDSLSRQKKKVHQALMKEQKRAKSSRSKGEKSIQNAKWPTIVSKAKALRAGETAGKKQKSINKDKETLINQLNDLNIPEEIKPKFDIPLSTTTNKALITINEGIIAYGEQIILTNINLQLTGNCRLALCGVNGSGKSTLLKAIMNDSSIRKNGLWITPASHEIGYLDQHYQSLHAEDSVLKTIEACRTDWTYAELRHHLNDFLFRKNEQVNAKVSNLSGGEKARLSLAKIAAKPPKLLILDELTNNLDFKTRNHVITMLKNYPGCFIVISHDDDFLEQININNKYVL